MAPAEQNIVSLIPQRPPFVLVDALISTDETLTRSYFLVKENSPLMQNGVLQEAGLIENIAQTAAARAGYFSLAASKPVQLGYIGAVKNLQVYGLPKINDRLETEVAVINQVFDVTVISGKVSCGNQLLAQCEMKIFISQPKQQIT
jgi:predicted hotdog family 3-hydroxylacyl-ACP dehydratase